MEELEMKKLWQLTQDKLSQTLQISQQTAQEMKRLKTQNLLRALKPAKNFALLVGALWVSVGVACLLNIYTHYWAEANKFFFWSAALQLLLTNIALAIYAYQLIMITQIDVFGPILDTQQKLNSLQTTTLWIAKVLVLQLPLWTTFWWNPSMLQTWHWVQWVITGSITAAFTMAALWLFVNISLQNSQKKWFQLLFSGKEWDPLKQAIDVLNQLEEYRQPDGSK